MKKELTQYHFPEDLKTMSCEEMELLSYAIREFLIEHVAKTGGHLASNLGVVELTLALHKLFDSPEDKIIWDVGHQSYVHKILTGRAEDFDTLRQFGGLSGFPKGKESVHDAFDTGHSSTSISAAAGYAAARDIQGKDYEVIAVIGDGSLTGGMAYEALNNIGASKSKVIVILNDNGMSISPNIGGISRHLGSLRTSKGYLSAKNFIKNKISTIPSIGKGLAQGLADLKNDIKYTMLERGGVLFEELGFTYFGPVDGHSLPELLEVLTRAKNLDEPVLIHVITKKGKGYEPAEKNPAHFHGVSPFDIKTGKPLAEKKYPTYTDVFSKKLCQLGETHPELVAVTAAMPDGTGVAAFGKKFPDRFFDVGIAEAHAVTSAAGMAAAGLRPVVAVYSSFLQRGYDQILHDVCIQNLPVLFAVDRAGLVGSDGETHQGIFDYSYLTSIPNMSVAAPKNLWELRAMLDFAMDYKAPFAIRYPRGTAYRGLKEFMQPIAYGKGEMIYEEENIALLAVGSMVSTGEHVRAKLKEEGVSCTLANARFVKPFDKELVDRLAKNHRLIVTMEENVLQGGFGLPVTAYIHEHYPQVKVMNIALPDAYVEHGNVSVLRKGLGIDSDSIIQRLKAEGWL